MMLSLRLTQCRAEAAKWLLSLVTIQVVVASGIAPWRIGVGQIARGADFHDPQADGEALPRVIPATKGYEVIERDDRLVIREGGEVIGEYVFGDAKILRPYFSNLLAPGRTQVTRNHPPREGVDATDHESMHPGLWFGFGELSGADFWRNGGRVRHVRFSEPPAVSADRVGFGTLSRLETGTGEVIGQVECRVAIRSLPQGRLIVWEATFSSEQGALVFGDQEEMGWGARVATPLTEKNGGVIVSSSGVRTAAKSWGQSADWCDYSGKIDGKDCGVTLMAGPDNFRPSWWHNRDYGVIVANAFGRAAMKQGERSEVKVAKGERLRLVYGAMLHDGPGYDPPAAYRSFVEATARSKEGR